MVALENKNVLVVGLGASGKAACDLLLHKGARVWAVDDARGETLEREASALKGKGVRVELGGKIPGEKFDLAVVSPGVLWTSPALKAVVERKIYLIGELELGYQNSVCLNVSITGTNGKTTTTELVECVLKHRQLKTVAAGNIGLPLCAVAEQTKEMDFLTLEVSSFQLETIEYFRPAVAVLLNITPDHLDRYAGMAEYAKAKARIFMNQQAFDWAIVQTEALAQLRALGVSIPSKIITFSASNRRADICLERGLLISRVEGWEGPLLNMDDCRLRGPHNAENLMAALAVGRVLRIPLESMVESLRSYTPPLHRCELVAEINGVQFINDSKSTNLDSLHKALLTVPGGRAGEANVLLISGGKDKGFEYHDVGPLLSQRVKSAYLIGETREKLRAAWSLFTPCTLADTLVEAVQRAAQEAASGDVVLLSPACSSFDQFQNYKHRGDVFRQAVSKLPGAVLNAPGDRAGIQNQFAPGREENPGAKN